MVAGVVFSCLTLCANTVAQAGEITVSAAASLADAIRELASQFEADSPQSRVQLNFAASGALLMQIARGAPVDVFASADERTMDHAEKQKLIVPATRRDLARGRLVLIVPTGATAVPHELSELAQARYARIAIGLPDSVPAGRYSRDALEAAGLWEPVAAKVVGASNVRQVLDYVARGEVDAGFVYATDAALMPARVRVALAVPGTRPIRYPVAVLADAPDRAEAQRFVDFLFTPQAQGVLARHGFDKP